MNQAALTRRPYVPLPERLAATLACLLPQEQRDDLRRRKVQAKAVVALFHFDHVIFHAHGGAAKWWNLDPKLVAVHREKTAKIDVPAIAKGKRIARTNEEFAGRLLDKSNGQHAYWPSAMHQGDCMICGNIQDHPAHLRYSRNNLPRKWPSRQFPKGRKISNRRKA